jgi:hypothetical protein
MDDYFKKIGFDDDIWKKRELIGLRALKIKYTIIMLGWLCAVAATIFILSGCATEQQMNELYGDYDCILQIDGKAFCK